MVRTLVLVIFLGLFGSHLLAIGQERPVAWNMTLRTRSIPVGDDIAVAIDDSEVWSASQTALIICDMWNLHHCYRAVQREEQMLSPMQKLIAHMRDSGSTIIHAPSGCMDHYQSHPSRLRAASIPPVPTPDEIESWCYKIDSESAVKYPIDQSDGGEDDTPEEHAAWVNQLTAMGVDPKSPWSKQHDGLTIDSENDFITDKGNEVWAILKSRGIENVILVGVHTNMCVLGRPFGLRQLAKNDVNVVLMRDMTDAMYNPASWPHVSHREGTQRIIHYIEQTVCPTITSNQVMGGQAFQFQPIAKETSE